MRTVRAILVASRRVTPLLATLCLWPSTIHAAPGVTRWTKVPEPMPLVSAENPDSGAFAVPTGFVVDKLFTVPRNELGSWVSLGVDPQGRIYACDQGDKGLVRITPAPIDGAGETVVEKVPAPITGAQGLLWAFDALYVVCNGGTGSGLYRVTDGDGDGMPETVTKLRDLQGGGEHGPHNIVLSPDGTRLFVICGNHTKLPFATKDVTPPQTMGGIRDSQRKIELPADGTSRLPACWDEDVIIPRMWDANGHATGILAPGGYIASTDPEGKTWELWSAGYRNPYDFAFNADGDVFAYDADMEWDFGTPWYRPTRVSHATSGSEFGWRSGTAKWPASYPDSLPALVDIGPGSPVGVCFGYGARFPEKYQRALYVCDWTFGTIYAIHLQPAGSSYSGTLEEFVARTPLPLTDAVIGRDGAMYFAVGGRGGQSELFRVRYAGSEATAAVNYGDQRHAADRAARRELEAMHRRADDPAAAVAMALPALDSSDQFIRYAARVALEHQPLELWQDKALAATSARGQIEGAIAVARQADPTTQSAVLAALDSIDPTMLEQGDAIALARAYQLALIRLGHPSQEAAARIASRFSGRFPSGNDDLDRELASLLVAVRAPGIVAKLVAGLAAPSGSATATNLTSDEESLRRLIQRNAHYGSSVRASLEKRGDLQQIHYAYVLRTLHDQPGSKIWSASDRKTYYEWFARARQWAGGNSFQKFLTNIENESLAGLSETEKLALETLGIRKPWVAPPLPKPHGPGKQRSVADVLALAEAGLTPGTRKFAEGKRAFSAARCIVCHRYGGDGGATGPDLTQAAGRFQLKDLVEAIVEPSRAISDQYKASVVQTDDGKVVTGRIVAEDADAITIVTDPEDATKFARIPRSSIEEIVASPVSLMPAGLLDQLNDNEVLDLIAYALARGNPKDARFKRGK
jgi:putative heme-binding domain-containing protein